VLHVATADALEVLADELAAVLARPLADPMQAEWIAAPSQGMARWLRIHLARSLGASGNGRTDGVAANLRIGFPGALRQAVLAAGRPLDEPDPWAIDRLVWSVLSVLHAGRDDPRLAPVTTIPDGATWYGRARRLADLFDRYGVHRPAMLRAWADGHDVDGAGKPISESAAWQPHLWRLVRERVGAQSPAELLPSLLERVGSGELALDLPSRCSFFGLTTLPGGTPFLDLVTAVAAQHDVHLFLFAPSPGMVEIVREGVRSGRLSEATLRADDTSIELVGHPLVRSWARPNREAVALLAAAETRGAIAPSGVVATPERPTDSLLRRFQADLRAGTAPVADFDAPDADAPQADRSIEIHAAHGPSRQVEVLRDAILHRLAHDPTLREDEILVVCPALDTFAPIVEAVFGPPAGGSGGDAPADGEVPRLAYRITDRSLRDTYGLLGALAALVDLVAGRFSASAVLDLLALAPVRLRFDLDDDDLDTIARWTAEAEVRWGLDGTHRGVWGIPGDYAVGSWHAVVDRLLVGVAVSDDGIAFATGDVLPLSVEGSGVPVVGRLAEVLARLADLAERFSAPRDPVAWCAELGRAATELLAAPVDAPWQEAALAKLLQAVAEQAAGTDVELTVADVRRLLAQHLGGEPGRSDFFRGGVTVSSLTPLRGVPFRTVCILGMDDGAFGASAADGDDLVAASPHVGDRDSRAETRQALLEAVLAAGETLVVTRTGSNVITNQAVPMSVPLVELRDALLATVSPARADAVAKRLAIAHPRQPFDVKNFTAGGVTGGGPWSFDPIALAGAVARAGDRSEASEFLTRPLPRAPLEVLDLGAVHRTLEHPVRGFLRGCLGLHLPRESEARSDDLPTDLVALEAWKVGERLLEAVLAGRSTEAWLRRERALGSLPAGALGDRDVEKLTTTIANLVASAGEMGFVAGSSTLRPIDLELDARTRLVGTVRVDHAAPPGPVRMTYSQFKAKHLVAPWLELMALVAQEPEADWQAVVVCRTKAGKGDRRVLRPVGETATERRERACAALEVAVECYRRSQVEPIPLFSVLSKKVYDGKAVVSDWDDFKGFADGHDISNQMAFGEFDFHELLAIPARVDDPPGPAAGRVDRFAQWFWGAFDASVVCSTDGSVTPVGSAP
jgi:exodeoxyribonuclease V gamma subunit